MGAGRFPFHRKEVTEEDESNKAFVNTLSQKRTSKKTMSRRTDPEFIKRVAGIDKDKLRRFTKDGTLRRQGRKLEACEHIKVAGTVCTNPHFDETFITKEDREKTAKEECSLEIGNGKLVITAELAAFIPSDDSQGFAFTRAEGLKRMHLTYTNPPFDETSTAEEGRKMTPREGCSFKIGNGKLIVTFNSATFIPVDGSEAFQSRQANRLKRLHMTITAESNAPKPKSDTDEPKFAKPAKRERTHKRKHSDTGEPKSTKPAKPAKRAKTAIIMQTATIRYDPATLPPGRTIKVTV